MPWKTTDAMKERTKFVLEWERLWKANEGRVNMSELCRAFGISRPQGYLWVKRYVDAGRDLSAIVARSRRPLHSPTKTSELMEARLVAARKKHPRWGPRKLGRWLLAHYPDWPVPNASTIGSVLERAGLTARRGRRRRGAPIPGVLAPFASCDRPNATWCIDFKGKFQTLDGRWCHVTTLVDAYSRFLLRCEAVLNPDGTEVERLCRSAFTEYGLPDCIRSDNGPPFASTGAGTLTRLSVWWLRLGLRVERIAKGRPDQNGRLERLHRSLEEVIERPGRDLRAQQRRFDLWRREYNEERPHEALGMRTPASFYAPSVKRFPCPLIRLEPSTWNRSFIVDDVGNIRWHHRKRLHISSSLAGELVEVERIGQMRVAIHFGAILLGWFDEDRLQDGLVVARQRRKGEMLSLALDAPTLRRRR
jgi:putative transposase